MTRSPNDEAFIRAILASPGCDLPRLVYAEYLEDCGDPRGAYLRAELAAPGNSARVAPLSAGLDAVWVARVSRPPVGVCCDLVNFRERGPAVTVADIDGVERRLGGRFAADYRAFLLDTNGGVPMTAVRWASATLDQCFYSTRAERARHSLDEHARRHLDAAPRIENCNLYGCDGADRWAEHAVPIADCGDFVLFLAFRGPHAGKLHLHGRAGDWMRFGFIADEPPTLPVYLHVLMASGMTIADTYYFAGRDPMLRETLSTPWEPV